MGRKRKNHNDLPKHWTFRYGAFYYRPPSKHVDLFPTKWVRLGKTLAESHRAYADLPIHEDLQNVATLADLLEKYRVEVIPKKAPRTQTGNRWSVDILEKTFKDFKIQDIKPKHIYQFFDALDGTRTARAHIEVLRHAYSKAVEWGILDRHPFKGEVTLPKNPPRTRYVTDEEFRAFREMASPKLQAYLLLKEATGLAKQDLLLIELSDIKEDGLHARRRKTKSKPKIYAWDTDGILHSGIDLARSAHRSHIGSRYLFHTRQGKPYYFVDEQGHATGKPEAFDSMWQRLMSKWVTAGNERFTEHDIRAKAASDTKSEHAQELMDHSTKEMTEKVYRRKPKVVHINKGE